MEYTGFIAECKKNYLRNPEKTFIREHESGKTIDYKVFGDGATGRIFKELNVGDVVFLEMENTIESIQLFIALLCHGIKPILIKKELPQRDRDNIANVILVNGCYSSKGYKAKQANNAEISRLDTSIAYLVFTSGSSGEPKGIQISYTNICAETEMMIEAYRLSENDTHLCVLPVFHASGLYRNVLMALFTGATTILVRSFNNNEFWSMLDKYNITFTQITPTVIRSLLSDKKEDYIKPYAIRFIGSASAPHPVELVTEFETTFDIPVLVGYGMTEATCGITLNADVPRKNFSVGKAIPGVDIRIVSEDGNECTNGDEGEVVIAGKNLMPGYLKTEGEDKIKVKDGSLHTGDVGYLDDGYLFLVGRQNDIVKRGSYRLNLIAIEKTINSFDFVEECAIIDVPSRFLGSDIVAFVVTKNNIEKTSNQIIKFAKDFISSNMMPSEFLLIDEIPKISNLKVDKKQLKSNYTNIKNAK